MAGLSGLTSFFNGISFSLTIIVLTLFYVPDMCICVSVHSCVCTRGMVCVWKSQDHLGISSPVLPCMRQGLSVS